MENRKCQLQTWKVEKYSGNLCAARTGRGVLGRSRRLAAEMPFPRQGGKCRRPAAGGLSVPTDRGKRGQGHRMVPLPPLDSPKPSFKPRLPSVARLNGGLRGLGSGRLSAYMQLSCPEFRLRGLPRITVRGQTVQGGHVLLRKAPLPSRVYPWSTRRHCGPLAFRCATEGSRSAKEGEGSQEGTGNHTWCPVPFCSRR